jgi:hypothetical protein
MYLLHIIHILIPVLHIFPMMLTINTWHNYIYILSQYRFIVLKYLINIFGVPNNITERFLLAGNFK